MLHPLVERTSEDLDGMLDGFVKCVVTRSRGPPIRLSEPETRISDAWFSRKDLYCESAGEKIQFIADDDGLEKNFIDCAYFFTKKVIVRTIGYTITLKA